MAKYLKSNKPAQKQNKRNNTVGQTTSLRRVRRNVYRQAALASITILLTIVILFAMTSAWYTNIVQTSGLVFEAEAWGFDGVITVNDGTVKAAPGDDGIVAMTVENNSDSVSAISVNVSKNAMADEMQKRLFFYVDARMNREGETMDPVYLNRYEGYTYNVFANNQLTMTEQISNAPVIKWEWVYDVLGYYVLAQPYEVQVATDVMIENDDGSTTPSTTIATTTKMDIKEYLRPIQYDFDEATTKINTNGELVSIELDTIDGTISPETFLWRISTKDGYEGEINPDDRLYPSNYYAVDVDENGYGVYAYLCNYSDIQLETKYDTELGELAKKLADGETLSDDDTAKLFHSVTLTLSAQKNENTAVNVGTLGALQNAIMDGTADVIKLSSGITIPEGQTLTVPENSKVMLDLSGFNITNVEGTAIKAYPGSVLTIMNGAVVQDQQIEEEASKNTCGIYAIGSEIVMSDVEIDDFGYGVYVGDNQDSNELDSRVYMVNCNVDAESYAVFISGNGLLSERKSQLIIEDSTLTSNAIVITGNGDSSGNGRWGTDIQIIGSTIAGTKEDDFTPFGSAIYQPQKNSTLTVYNSHIEGYNGITIKGGSANIVDSTVKGLGAYTEPSIEGSGFTDTGDAIYIETSYSYDIELTISGDKSILIHTDPQSKSLRVFEEDADNVLVQIEGGRFDEAQPDEYIATGAVQNIVDNKAVVSKEQ